MLIQLIFGIAGSIPILEQHTDLDLGVSLHGVLCIVSCNIVNAATCCGYIGQ